MAKEDIFATEQRNFWCAYGELNEAVRDGADQTLIDYHLEEIEAIHMHTEQRVLRERCAAILVKHDRLKTANG